MRWQEWFRESPTRRILCHLFATAFLVVPFPATASEEGGPIVIQGPATGGFVALHIAPDTEWSVVAEAYANLGPKGIIGSIEYIPGENLTTHNATAGIGDGRTLLVNTTTTGRHEVRRAEPDGPSEWGAGAWNGAEMGVVFFAAGNVSSFEVAVWGKVLAVAMGTEALALWGEDFPEQAIAVAIGGPLNEVYMQHESSREFSFPRPFIGYFESGFEIGNAGKMTVDGPEGVRDCSSGCWYNLHNSLPGSHTVTLQGLSGDDMVLWAVSPVLVQAR